MTNPTPSHRKTAALRRVVGAGVLVIAGLLALPQAADAQTRGADRVERQVERLTEALDLSDAQAVELRALFEAQAADRPARSERGRAEREARRAQVRERRAEAVRQIEAILSPDQVERFHALRAERRDGR